MLIDGFIVPFIAGFAAVLIFHQGVWALFSAAGKTPSPAWSLEPTGPMKVPAVVNAAFWGGLWGIAMAWVGLPLFGPALGYWLTCVGIGALSTSLVALLVVFPAKGRAFAAGWNPVVWAFALLVNAAWGFGFGWLMPLLGGALH